MNVIEESPRDEEPRKKDIAETPLTFWKPKTTVEARRRKDREDRVAQRRNDNSHGDDAIQDDDTPSWGAVIVPPWLEGSRQRQISIEPTGASRRTNEPTTPTRPRTNLR